MRNRFANQENSPKRLEKEKMWWAGERRDQMVFGAFP